MASPVTQPLPSHVPAQLVRDIDIANEGVATESATLRIGTEGIQNAAYMAGLSMPLKDDHPDYPALLAEAARLSASTALER